MVVCFAFVEPVLGPWTVTSPTCNHRKARGMSQLRVSCGRFTAVRRGNGAAMPAAPVAVGGLEANARCAVKLRRNCLYSSCSYLREYHLRPVKHYQSVWRAQITN